MNEVLFWFTLIFTLPSFGGETEVKVTTRTLDGCERLQKVITRELQDRKMEKFTVRECPDGRIMPERTPISLPTVILP